MPTISRASVTSRPAVLIPFVVLAGLVVQLDKRVDLFGGSGYEEIYVAKGERLQMMFQDGTRVYINSDSRLKYPKKFALSSREVYLEGEAYFEVAKDEEDLVKFLADDDHQDELITLEGKLKAKKIAST